MIKTYFSSRVFVGLFFAGIVFVTSIYATPTVKPFQYNQQVSFDFPIGYADAGASQ